MSAITKDLSVNKAISDHSNTRQFYWPIGLQGISKDQAMMLNFVTGEKRTFRGFFLWLLAIFVGAGLLEGFDLGAEILFAVMTLLLLLAVRITQDNGKHHIFHTIISATIICNLAAYFTSSWIVDVVSLSLSLIVFSYASWLIFMRVFSVHEVNSDLIFGAVSIYLLIGIDCALAFQLTAMFDSNAFSFIAEAKASTGIPVIENFLRTYIYYSFVTLTSTGYGDIVPVDAPARYISIIEAIAGHVYLSVLVARLVGLHLTAQPLQRR